MELVTSLKTVKIENVNITCIYTPQKFVQRYLLLQYTEKEYKKKNE